MRIAFYIGDDRVGNTIGDLAHADPAASSDWVGQNDPRDVGHAGCARDEITLRLKGGGD